MKYSEIKKHGIYVSVDASYVIHRYAHLDFFKDGVKCEMHMGIENVHLIAVYHSVIHFLRNGLIPYFVFDGKMPLEKRGIYDTVEVIDEKDIVEFRHYNVSIVHGAVREISTGAKLSAVVLGKSKTDPGSVSSGSRYVLDHEKVHQCQILLTALGLPWMTAIGEADPQCSALDVHPRFAGAVSGDSDLPVYGTRITYTNFSPEISNDVDYVCFDDLFKYFTNLVHKIQKAHEMPETEVTHDNFVDLCVAFGTDYCATTIDLSHDDILKLFVRCNLSLSRFFRTLEKKNIRFNKTILSTVVYLDTEMPLWKRIRYIYKNSVVWNLDKINTELGPLDKDVVKKIMHEKCQMDLGLLDVMLNDFKETVEIISENRKTMHYPLKLVKFTEMFPSCCCRGTDRKRKHDVSEHSSVTTDYATGGGCKTPVETGGAPPDPPGVVVCKPLSAATDSTKKKHVAETILETAYLDDGEIFLF